MYHRLIALLAVISLALGGGGCGSLKITRIENPEAKKDYQEVMMPLQTGSVLHRRTYVQRGPETKKTAPKKKKKSSAESGTKPADRPPAPDEESTPPPDRFR